MAAFDAFNALVGTLTGAVFPGTVRTIARDVWGSIQGAVTAAIAAAPTSAATAADIATAVAAEAAIRAAAILAAPAAAVAAINAPALSNLPIVAQDTITATVFKTSIALVGVAGGAAAVPAAAGIGGAGQPATAAQNGWLKMADSTGSVIWVPVWK